MDVVDARVSTHPGPAWLQPWLAWLDAALHREILRLRARYALSSDELRGLYVGHGLTAYEEEVGVPILVRFPGGRYAGVRNRGVVSLIDLFPTICAAASVVLNGTSVAGTSPSRAQSGSYLSSTIHRMRPAAPARHAASRSRDI